METIYKDVECYSNELQREKTKSTSINRSILFLPRDPQVKTKIA